MQEFDNEIKCAGMIQKETRRQSVQMVLKNSCYDMLWYGMVCYNIFLNICYAMLFLCFAKVFSLTCNSWHFAAEAIIYGSNNLIECENGLKIGSELESAEESTRWKRN